MTIEQVGQQGSLELYRSMSSGTEGKPRLLSAMTNSR